MEECRGLAMRRRGQVRIVEAVLATFMVVAVILMVMAFTRPLKSTYIRETTDLRRLAYNLLNDMATAGVYERTVGRAITNPGNKGWIDDLRLLVSSSLPPELVFNMTIYRVDFNPASGATSFVKLGSVANSDFSRIQLYESESVTYTYVATSDPDKVRGMVIYIVLTLGFAG
ncbi:hypothetical protein IG193_03120 [Infirmifilum lucidum]|uniref:Uncharacterized protein n=1 Tax=Infirmifilum lucidum TaxID=2776706 RepID=A0A7L9FKS7_9CREN|nr:hypothetical protein [Infirmifilum lucidum]QOJ79466.1 hypothetical protein IG193_03120 [Infirmifilum lucidum]